MSDAVSNMMREDRTPEEVDVEVTAIIKYDLFPFYDVQKGYLKRDGAVHIPGIGTYQENLIRVLPRYCFKEEEYKRISLCNLHREKILKSEIQLLKSSGVGYLTSIINRLENKLK